MSGATAVTMSAQHQSRTGAVLVSTRSHDQQGHYCLITPVPSMNNKPTAWKVSCHFRVVRAPSHHQHALQLSHYHAPFPKRLSIMIHDPPLINFLVQVYSEDFPL